MDQPEATPTIPLRFGVFYPQGSVVLAFPDAATAERVRVSLLEGGYDDTEVQLFTAEYVAKESETNTEHASALAKVVGAELDAVAQHLALAKEGNAFLVVPAPSDAETTRVLRVAHRHTVTLAQKYDRFTISELL